MSTIDSSALLDTLVSAGGVVTEYHGRRLVRHFGSPGDEYEAAIGGVAVFDRSHRTRLRVRGRSPRQMLNGILTGRVPEAPVEEGEGLRRGMATYHAVLTPKGKMVTDLWAMLLGDEDGPGFLLDVPVAGRAALLEHLVKYLPPRFAAIEDLSTGWASISLVGPDAAAVVSREALASRVEAGELSAAQEGAWWTAAPGAEGLAVARTADVWPDAFTAYGPTGEVAALWHAVVKGGATPAGLGVWSTLRVEAGRPSFGTDMDDSTIPIEAGIHDRAIDYRKGCYTGQEVIVRIRDRGHVNRHLRLLDLGDAPAPRSGAELRAADGDTEKVVGQVTSAVESPRTGGTLALAYVRRGVEKVTLDGREVVVPGEEAGR